jgi:formylglycine-generating enzyme required for sulfatase activity
MKAHRLPLMALLCLLPLWVCAETIEEVLEQAESVVAERFKGRMARESAERRLQAIYDGDASEADKVAAIQALIAVWSPQVPSDPAPPVQVPVPGADTDGDGIPDDRDLNPLVMDGLPLSVNVVSVALGWDLDQQYEHVETVQAELRKLQVTESGYGGKLSISTEVGVDAPFALFGMTSSQAAGYFRAGFGATGEAHWSRSTRESSEAMAQVLARHTKVFKNMHLGFFVTIVNPGEKEYVVAPAAIAVKFGGGVLVKANPVAVHDKIGLKAKSEATIEYRAELNTTRALDVVQRMGAESPEISVLDSQTIIIPEGSDDDMRPRLKKAVAKTLPVTLATREGPFLSFRVARHGIDGNPLTVGKALDAINAVVRDDAGNPLFKVEANRLVGIGVRLTADELGYWQVLGPQGRTARASDLDLVRTFYEPLILEYYYFNEIVNLPEIGKLMPIPAGSFTMGSPESEEGRDEDEKQHPVRITRPFWMARHEVTHAQWKEIMGTTVEQQRDLANRANNSSYILFRVESQAPMVWVNWQEAMDFCAVIDRRERAAGRVPDGYEYRLPTEAEWEYACRAGTTTCYHSGNSLEALHEVGWYAGNSGTLPYPDKELQSDLKKKEVSLWQVVFGEPYVNSIHHYRLVIRIVGGKKPNAWGLHDMHGNAWEWCLDWYGNYPEGEVTAPFGPATGSRRVIRGGSWKGPSQYCRSAARGSRDAPGSRGSRDSNLGFRVVLAPVRPR